MGESEGHGCWVPNTPVKSGPSICKDSGDSGRSGGVDDDGFHHWQAALMENPLPDAIESKLGDLKPMSDRSESIFNTGFEGTRFDPLVDNKFIAVGQNMWINSNYAPPTSPNGEPTPSQHSFDHSSSSLFAPITPDQSKKAENGRICSNQTPDNQLANESSCADVSTQVGENHNPDTDQLIKTPQQKPRRKKHRPKVVKEGQAKRGRKPATPKPEVNKETTPTGKRKYVRKNKTQGLPENKETPKVKRKYVKRKGVDKTPEISTGELLSKWADTKNETHGQKSCKKRLNFDDDCSVIEESSLCNENAESQAQNFQIMAGNAKNEDLVEELGPREQNESKIGKCRIVFSDKTHDKEEPVLEMLMNNNYNNTTTKPAPSLKRRSKNMIGSHYNSLSKYETLLFPAYTYDVSEMNVSTTVITKKPKRGHSKKTTSNDSSSSSKAAAENSEKEVAPYIFNNAYMTSGTSFYPSRYQTQMLSFGAQLQQQSFEYQLLLEHATMMKEMRCSNAAMVYGLSSVLANVERDQVPCHTAGGSSQCGYLQIYQSGNPGHACVEIKAAKAHKTRKNRMRKRGVAWKKKPTVDDITEYLKQLQIDPMNKEKNALVPYSRDGTVVPFGGSFNPMKKHRQRAKVNIDSETDRVWKLLLENINSEGIDGTDEEKAKWWEEERRVFQGRADSFIARMHLVQGDRRFSPWKGSVVDSVVGVFLTQNVSDHASSSAFMSLAAHFPIKSKASSEPCSKEDMTVKEQKVQITEPDDNSKSCYPNGPHTTFMELLQMAENQKGFQDWDIGCSISSCTENIVNTLNLGRGMYNQNTPNGSEENCASEQSEITVESASLDTVQKVMNVSSQSGRISADVETGNNTEHKQVESIMTDPGSTAGTSVATSELKKGNTGKKKETAVDWDMLRVKAEENGKRERTADMMDSLDWEAVLRADVDEVAGTIKARGMSNVLAGRIQAFLERIVTDHGSIDLEWLRDAPPDKTKEYLLSFRGLGLKSVECVRLLTLHHLAFPVDTNVGRIAVRLGWVPLQTLPESLQLHLLELYPVLESIQQYLWPRLCKLDQRTLYELHYQMITFGKVFCTKSKPNCNACPMRGECRHFASAFASARLALPGPEDKSIVVNATGNKESKQNADLATNRLQLPEPQPSLELLTQLQIHMSRPTVEVPTPPIVEEPIIEVPNTPEPETQVLESDIEDAFPEDPEEIPTIRLNLENFTHNLQTYMERNMVLQEGDMSKALVALTQQAASIPMPKLKNVNQLRTEHQVYELPDSHPLLKGLDKREPDDPCSYLLAIWTPGETANSIEQPEYKCSSSQESGNLCEIEACFSCNSVREANSQTVRGTLLIPCRTAMRGSFPLNGTYFQVNEVFADHASSIKPIDVPRSWLWNLPRRIVYFGTSIPTIFKGLSTETIQYCFWRGFVCVRGFDQKTRAPRPLMARLHFPASKLPKASGKTDEKKE